MKKIIFLAIGLVGLSPLFAVEDWTTIKTEVQTSITASDHGLFLPALEKVKTRWKAPVAFKTHDDSGIPLNPTYNELQFEGKIISPNQNALVLEKESKIKKAVIKFDGLAQQVAVKRNEDHIKNSVEYMKASQIGWMRTAGGIALGSITCFWGLGVVARLFSGNGSNLEVVTGAGAAGLAVFSIPVIGQVGAFTFLSGAITPPIVSVPAFAGLAYGTHRAFNPNVDALIKKQFDDSVKKKANAEAIQLGIAEFRKAIEKKK